MATFDKHSVSSIAKMLIVGDSGAGKTASIASLIKAGYNVAVMDFDNGLDILASLVSPDEVNRLHYITFEDDPKGMSAWQRFNKICIEGWKDGDEDLGKITSWDPSWVLVIDTLTFMSKASMRQVLKDANKTPDTQPSLPDYGEAMRRIDTKIQWLCSSLVKCNVVMFTHLKAVENEDTGRVRYYPSTIGTALSQSLGTYFNNVMRIGTRKTKEGDEKFLRTISDNQMDLKTAAPKFFSSEIPLDLGYVIDMIKNNAQKMKA